MTSRAGSTPSPPRRPSGGTSSGAGEDHLLELTRTDRDRIFNLGYFTWVEQQGIPLAEFEARREQSWWRELRSLLPAWDAMIDEFNGRTGVGAAS